jgi:hypothetical protein
MGRTRVQTGQWKTLVWKGEGAVDHERPSPLTLEARFSL